MRGGESAGGSIGAVGVWLLGLLVAGLILVGCGQESSDSSTSGSTTIDFWSPAVQANGVISPRVSCGAGTLWLATKWGAVPEEAEELAVYLGRFKYETVDGARRLVAPFGALIYEIDPELRGIAANTFPPEVGPTYFGQNCLPVRRGQNVLMALYALGNGAATPQAMTADFATRLTEEALGVKRPGTRSEPAARFLENTLATGHFTATYGPK